MDTNLADQPLPVGTLLQQRTYRIDKVLGRYGFGITYQALEINFGRPVVIKGEQLKVGGIRLLHGSPRRTPRRPETLDTRSGRCPPTLH